MNLSLQNNLFKNIETPMEFENFEYPADPDYHFRQHAGIGNELSRNVENYFPPLCPISQKGMYPIEELSRYILDELNESNECSSHSLYSQFDKIELMMNFEQRQTEFGYDEELSNTDMDLSQPKISSELNGQTENNMYLTEGMLDVDSQPNQDLKRNLNLEVETFEKLNQQFDHLPFSGTQSTGAFTQMMLEQQTIESEAENLSGEIPQYISQKNFLSGSNRILSKNQISTKLSIQGIEKPSGRLYKGNRIQEPGKERFIQKKKSFMRLFAKFFKIALKNERKIKVVCKSTNIEIQLQPQIKAALIKRVKAILFSENPCYLKKKDSSSKFNQNDKELEKLIRIMSEVCHRYNRENKQSFFLDPYFAYMFLCISKSLFKEQKSKHTDQEEIKEILAVKENFEWLAFEGLKANPYLQKLYNELVFIRVE